MHFSLILFKKYFTHQSHKVQNVSESCKADDIVSLTLKIANVFLHDVRSLPQNRIFLLQFKNTHDYITVKFLAQAGMILAYTILIICDI